MVVNEISRIEQEGKVYVEAVVGPYALEYTHNPETGFTDVCVCRTEDTSRFAPAIYFDRNLAKNEDGTFRKVARFKIQTTSYGSLTLKEFNQFMGAQQTALDVVATIKEYFKIEEVL